MMLDLDEAGYITCGDGAAAARTEPLAGRRPLTASARDHMARRVRRRGRAGGRHKRVSNAVADGALPSASPIRSCRTQGSLWMSSTQWTSSGFGSTAGMSRFTTTGS